MDTLYYVDKISDTSADTLLAIGFASLLSRILGGRRRGIVLSDKGPYYQITLPRAITDADLQTWETQPLVLSLLTEKQASKHGAALNDGFDYERARAISQAHYEKIKKLPPEYRTPEARLRRKEIQPLAEIEEPPSELPHYQAIQQMKIASSFNELAQRWMELKTLQREHVHLLLTLFERPGNDIEAAVKTWQKLKSEHGLKGKEYVAELQIVNPTTGKGVNRTKPAVLSEGNPDSFWLLELLKFAGFMFAAAPYMLQGSKDRKTYILQPRVIELSTLVHMMHEFRAVCWPSTAVKLDVMASLRFTQVFVELRRQALRGESESDPLQEEQVYSIAQGFEVTSYKDMGSAYATMNVSTINVPCWLPRIPTLDEAERAKALLEEHLALIQQIRTSKGEEGAEEYELLRHYRNFLSGRDLKPFWRFTTAYSSYIISQREHGRYIRQLTTTGLENIITMSETKTQKQLTPITSNPGFQRIAYAIRQATVKAQYRRSQQRDRTYEVHYGLGQELMRDVPYAPKFIAALSKFIQSYNAETAREEEKVANKLARSLTIQDRQQYGLRGSVAYTDINEIVQLVDEFGSETVGSLLIAYGYASDPRKDPQEKPGPNGNQPIEPEPANL